jgi:hypothetical protein
MSADDRPYPTLANLLHDQYRWVFVGGKVRLPVRQC